MKKKGISIFLFLLGIGVFLFPTFSQVYYDYSQRHEFEQITKQMKNDPTFNEAYEEQKKYNQSDHSNVEKIQMAEVSFIEEDSSLKRQESDTFTKEMIAILSIPKLDLIYPVYDGATHENLLRGVARIEGTSYPLGGLDTNSVIAGHNGLVDRTYFSYIKELNSGDLIMIQNSKEQLTYEVYKTKTIQPDDMNALRIIPGQDTLTLLTCTWPPPGTHRYLVYARRVSNQPEKTISKKSSKTKNIVGDSNIQNTRKTFSILYHRYRNILWLTIGAFSLFYLTFVKKTKDVGGKR